MLRLEAFDSGLPSLYHIIPAVQLEHDLDQT
jgi:hypothetical protein